ncbi:MAG: carboxypeptidase regulatory-like domain-containing protein [Deltaproteobacteria bacterium]|nr:carboxypeptidase regulatory-like domain-containing protein [Deltaproteobacteria bacterium]
MSGSRALLLGVLLGAAGLSAAAGKTGSAEALFTLHGRVSDRQGKPSPGAEVALYRTPDTRRPVDFITPPTIENGTYAIGLPPGTYWAVARQRTGPRYGPLQPSDRHSGAPVEIEGKAGEVVVADFTIASVRELGEERRAPEGEVLQLRGRLIDKEGAPAANAYLFARRDEGKAGLPDFLSPPADGTGACLLLLPPGTYYVGADVVFPPREGRTLKKVNLTPDQKDLSIDLEVAP